VGTRGPLAAAQWDSGCTDPGTPSILVWVFQKRKRKRIPYFGENTLEICILFILAPNWMKQVLLGFFGVYLQVKNIAYQVCDTFLYSFILFLKMLLIFRNA
jgi:hypothetical protein